MNIKRSLFVFFALSFVFQSGELFAQSGRDNFLLKDVNSCRVLVTPEDASLAEYAGLWARMERDITERLNRAGLNAESARQNPGRAGFGVSEYNVEISRFDAANPERIVLLAKTTVTVDVVVNRRTGRSMRIAGWIKGGSTQARELAGMGTAIASLVFKQTSEFIGALKTVNNPSVTQGAGESTSRANKNENEEEYKYVASRLSRVFHKPDCMWAERIKEENLVKYKTRQQAIDDGKRPCKRCEP